MKYFSQLEFTVLNFIKFFGFAFIYSNLQSVQFAIAHDRFLESYPEVKVIAGDGADLAKSPTACLIGKTLAETYGWGVGDTIPMIGTIYPRTDGEPWQFEVVGVYESVAPVFQTTTTRQVHRAPPELDADRASILAEVRGHHGDSGT